MLYFEFIIPYVVLCLFKMCSNVCTCLVLLGTFGIRRSSKTGFNSISVVQCVNRYPQTKVGIAVDRNNTKIDTEPKVRAGKLRRDSKK